MKTNLKYHAVNWTDGMKLTENHFAEGDAHMHDVIRDAASSYINSYNYGLMPPLEGMSDPIKLSVINHPNSHVEIVLEGCNAITSNGTRLVYSPEFYGDQHPRLSIPASSMEGKEMASFFILVNINPFKRIPIGMPDPEEIPLRHPNSYPEITIQRMPYSKTNSTFIGAFQFLIGELRWENSTFYWDDSYIPPCTTMSSHPTLVEFMKKTVEKLNVLKNHSTTIVRSNKYKQVGNKLAQNTCGICNEILEFVSRNIFEIKQILPGQPPIYFVNRISVLANNISTYLGQMEDRQKEELLQYYHEWENVRPVDFESVLGELMELNYEHTDITKSLVSIKKFLDTLILLWQKLSLLEYVGQRKDNIVIRAVEETQNERRKERFSLLD